MAAFPKPRACGMSHIAQRKCSRDELGLVTEGHLGGKFLPDYGLMSCAGERESSQDRRGPNHTDWTIRELRNSIDAAGLTLWTWMIDNDEFVMDAKSLDLWDASPETGLTFEHLSAQVHPAARDRFRTTFEATRLVDSHFEIDFRILTSQSDLRWIFAWSGSVIPEEINQDRRNSIVFCARFTKG